MAGLMESIESHLRETHSLPENFMFFRWACMPLDGPTIYYEMEGGLVNSVYRSGPRKGRPNYKASTDRKVFRVTVEECRKLFK